jgi:hypothetical protein
MSIRVTERHESRSTSRSPDDRACRQLFAVMGAISTREAERAVLLQPRPPEVDWHQPRVTVETAPVFFDRDNPESNVYEVTRTYASRSDPDEDDGIEWRLSMTTASATCTTARRATAAPGSRPFWEPPEPQEPEGAGSPINVRRVNGRDETGGVEIAVPSFKLALGFECPAKKWRLLRPVLLRVPRGAVNADTFQGFEPGELLFAGFDASRIDSESFRLSYTFDISPNEDFTAGDFTITDAPGWSAKWSYWGSEEEVETPDPDGGTRTIIRPKCDGAYASEVHGRMRFSTLLPSAIADELEP